ncbi:MAG: hypothetical protein JNK42_01445 [Caedimonas sp.]|nr:hypothetical protein [Caedimonas sp.]
MKLKSFLYTLVAAGLVATPAHSLSLNFLKRGFKHCTGVCDDAKVCSDQDKILWCTLNCDHKDGMLDKMIGNCNASKTFWQFIQDLKNNAPAKLSAKDNQKVQNFVAKATSYVPPAPTDAPPPPVLPSSDPLAPKKMPNYPPPPPPVKK